MGDEATKEAVRMVYVGKRLGTKNKLLGCWYILESPEHDPITNEGDPLSTDWKTIAKRTRLYQKLKPPNCTIGMIYTFDQDKSHAITSSSYRDADRWKNNNDIMRWEVDAKTDYHRDRQNSIAKRLGKTGAFSEAVEPLRVMYHKLSTFDRQTFLVMLLSELDKPPRPERW